MSFERRFFKEPLRWRVSTKLCCRLSSMNHERFTFTFYAILTRSHNNCFTIFFLALRGYSNHKTKGFPRAREGMVNENAGIACFWKLIHFFVVFAFFMYNLFGVVDYRSVFIICYFIISRSNCSLYWVIIKWLPEI